MKKRIFTKGDIINGFEFIKDLPTYVKPSGKTTRIALVRCSCGEIEKSNLYMIMEGKKQSCKKCRHKLVGEKNTHHGLVGHKIYSIWADIKKRCYNKNHKAFENYGAKGIKMFEGWINDVKAFYDYVTTLKNYDEKKLGIKCLTIDRIDNEQGYYPNNLRWAKAGLQNYNKPLQKNNITGLKAINKRLSGRYQVCVGHNKKKICIGTFDTIEIAKEARDIFLKSKGIYESYTKYEPEISNEKQLS